MSGGWRIKAWVALLALWVGGAACAASAAGPGPAAAKLPKRSTVAADVLAAGPEDALIVQARQAFQNGGATRLEALRAQLPQHVLEPWLQYWSLSLKRQALSQRLELGQSPPQPDREAFETELEAFRQLWPGTYVVRRAINDWLLDLGRAQAWDDFDRWLPLARQDDPALRCHIYLHMAQTQDVTEVASSYWRDQSSEACDVLGAWLLINNRIPAARVWQQIRQYARVRNASAAARLAQLSGLADPAVVLASLNQPARWLKDQQNVRQESLTQVVVLALARLAATQREAAIAALSPPAGEWRMLPADAQSYLWGEIGLAAALERDDRALGWYARASDARALSPIARAWRMRELLRQGQWAEAVQVFDTLTERMQQEARWRYWLAYALTRRGGAGDEARARGLWTDIASNSSRLGFYPLLARESLGERWRPVSNAPAVSPIAVALLRQQPEWQRAIKLLRLDLRPEGLRQWASLTDEQSDETLHALAQSACEAEMWDRCIHAADLSTDMDLRQSFVMPFGRAVHAAAQREGLDAALLFGLIRQESRFQTGVSSSAGARGLMQLMPATARWLARKLALNSFQLEHLADPEVNVLLGAEYLRRVLERYQGSAPLALAAYNAGPGRADRWRQFAPTHADKQNAALFSELIPIPETSDYVQRVLANATIYAWRLNPNPPAGQEPSLFRYLGTISRNSPAPTPATSEAADELP